MPRGSSPSWSAPDERVYRVEVRHSSLEEVYLEAVGGQTG